MKMQFINIEKYRVYLECIGDENLWGRIKVPKTKFSEEEFSVLADLEENFKDYCNKYYSKKIKEKIKEKIDKLTPYVTHEVLQILEKGKN